MRFQVGAETKVIPLSDIVALTITGTTSVTQTLLIVGPPPTNPRKVRHHQGSAGCVIHRACRNAT